MATNQDRTRTQGRRHAGEGRGVENAISFIIIFAIFLCGIWILSFATLTTVWPYAACLALMFIAFFVPQMVMGISNTSLQGVETIETDESEFSAESDGRLHYQ